MVTILDRRRLQPHGERLETRIRRVHHPNPVEFDESVVDVAAAGDDASGFGVRLQDVVTE